MHAFEAIAEQRISEAVARGGFDNLPGSGQSLNLDEDLLVPEVHTLKEIGALERLVQLLDDGEERGAASRKLRLLGMQLGEMRGVSLHSRLATMTSWCNA